MLFPKPAKSIGALRLLTTQPRSRTRVLAYVPERTLRVVRFGATKLKNALSFEKGTPYVLTPIFQRVPLKTTKNPELSLRLLDLKRFGVGPCQWKPQVWSLVLTHLRK